MKLYTAGSTIENRKACQELGVGLMMCDGWRNPSEYPYFAVDNGAYSAWIQGKPWNPAPFLAILSRCAERGLKPDFAVLPDIVGGGDKSLARSHYWRIALSDLFPRMKWALAVQDGMTEESVYGYAIKGQIETIFVGGTMDWKLRTMDRWIAFAHERGLTCHVGRIGTVDRMVQADTAGADSIDSTTWVQRNGALRHHVEAYRERMRTRRPLEGWSRWKCSSRYISRASRGQSRSTTSLWLFSRAESCPMSPIRSRTNPRSGKRSKAWGARSSGARETASA